MDGPIQNGTEKEHLEFSETLNSMTPIIAQFVAKHDIKEVDGEIQMTTAQKRQFGSLFSNLQRDTADVCHRGMLVCHIDRNKPSDSYDATLGEHMLFRDQSSKQEMKDILDMRFSTIKKVPMTQVQALKDMCGMPDLPLYRSCFEPGHQSRNCPNEETPFPQHEIDGGERFMPRCKDCSSTMTTKDDKEQEEKQEDENDEEDQDDEENEVKSGEGPYVGADIQVLYDDNGEKKWYKEKITSRERGVDKWSGGWNG
jgi:hypothetical protein